MERCGLRALNFSNISDDELDRHLTEAAKDFPFCGEQMLKFLYKERGINGVSGYKGLSKIVKIKSMLLLLLLVSRKLISDPKTSHPSN